MFFIGSLTSEGNGLGLYVAQKAIEHLEGIIRVKSVLEKGSVFTIYIPQKVHESEVSTLK